MASGRSKKIARNTFVLYIQMLLGMLIGLYTSRVILNELGVEDYGLYNVVGGIVAMFGILNMSMSSSTTRFLTFEIGKGRTDQVREVFGLSLTIHLLLGILVILLAEPIGMWFMKQQMQIPAERFTAVTWVFYCAIVNSFIAIFNVPYNALIVAYERMNVYAYFSLIDIVLKLVIVFMLPYVNMDKLKLYAILLLAEQLVMQAIYWLYCISTFRDARVGPLWDQTRFREMSSFAGWSLFGDSAAMMFTQGVNILLNVFFGPAVNAARGIAVQVQNVVGRFIGSFQTALNPQLTKSYAADDFAYMHKLIYASSKFSFYLFLLLSLPVFFETKALLTWWLKIVPTHTIAFVRIMLLISLVECLANPLIVSAKATGQIRRYQGILGSMLLLIVPISYFLLRFGLPPETVFIVHLVIVCIGQYVRVYLVRTLVRLDGLMYLKQVIVKVLIVFFVSGVFPTILYYTIEPSVSRVFVISFISCVSVVTTIWFIGLGNDEKMLAESQLKALIKKLKFQ